MSAPPWSKFMSDTPQHDAYEIYHKLDGEKIGYAFLSKSRSNVEMADLDILPCIPPPTPTDVMEDETSKDDGDGSATTAKKDHSKPVIIGEDHGPSATTPNRGLVDFSSSSISVTTEESKEIDFFVKKEISSSNLPDPKKMKFTDCEKQKSLSTDIGPLNLPGAHGWQRECVMTRGAVTMVNYLAPPDKQGNRRRLKSMKLCLEEANPDSQLTNMNFSFRKEVLGLREGYEICREHLLYNRDHHQSIYRDFFKPPKEGDRFVVCTLCGRTSSYANFSTHMRKYHLPDETCPMCSLELGPTKMPAHLRTCNNMQNKKPSSVAHPQPSTGPANQDTSDCSVKPTNKARIILRWSESEPPSQYTVEMQTDQPISKAIAKVARRLGVSRNSLTCWVEEEKLTGSETAGELEGTVVRVVKKQEGSENSEL